MFATIGDMKKNPFDQPIEIFRAGRQTSDDGRTFDITPEMLQASASAYDPVVHEAPLVVGHPKTNLPAYGWAAGLSVNNGVLCMASKQVMPQFAELVADGRYKKRSASFYLPDDPSNPKPGVLYLRHVGWLGAEPPAVKGLADVQFSEGSGSVEFSESITTGVTASIFRGIRDLLIDKFGLDTANQTIPDYQVAQLEQMAVADQITGDPTLTPLLFSETQTQQDIQMSKELQAELDAEKAARTAERARAEEAERKLAEFAEAGRRVQHAGIVAFAEDQIKAGRVLPKDKEALVAALGFVADVPDAKPISFSEAGVEKKTSVLEWFKGFIASGKPSIDFSEVAGGELPPERELAPKSDADLDRRAKEYSAKHNVSYSEAVSKVATFSGV